MKLLVLALFAATLADTLKKVDVVCPLDGTRFTANEVVRTDASLGWGGVDTDLCRHAFRTLPMEHYVWTCPTCWYSGSKEDFGAKVSLSEDLKKRLKESLKPAIALAARSTQEQIPGWVKYDLFAQVEGLKNAPILDVAKRHLHAAWSARQAGAIRLDDYDDFVEVAKSAGLDKTPLDLGKKNRSEEDLAACRKLEGEMGKHNGTALMLRRYLLAVTYRRRGENVDALRWLDEVDKTRGENSVIDDAVKKVRESIAVERAQQKKAAELYAKAVEGAELNATTRAECFYMLGEIARRSGEKAQAAGWYDKAIGTSPDDALKKRATAQKGLLK